MMSTKKMSHKKVRMRGFMCQSPASTAVGCMPDDMRTVIVPGKRNGRSMVVNNDTNHEHAKITRNIKYSRLNKSNKGRELLLPLSDKNLKGDHQQPFVAHQHERPSRLQLSSLGSDEIFQVVVLRVSLHCQGCAGKVKKHLSRMEGVTSFNIDMETKRVTVMGHVSPAGVLESVSKIKRAEFWTC